MILTFMDSNRYYCLMDTQKYIRELLGFGLKQAQIAKEVPCSQAHVSLLNSGKRGARTSEALAKKVRKVWLKHRAATK